MHVDVPQGLTLCRSVHGRRRQCTDGQANPSGFHMRKSSLTTLHTGSAFNPRSEYIKKKAGHIEDMLGFYRQVVPWSMLLKLGETRVQLESSGRISVDVAGLYPFEHGAALGSSP